MKLELPDVQGYYVQGFMDKCAQLKVAPKMSRALLDKLLGRITAEAPIIPIRRAPQMGDAYGIVNLQREAEQARTAGRPLREAFERADVDRALGNA